MNNNLLKKLNYYIGLLPAGAIFGLLVYSASFEIKDLDLWLHIGMGRYITLHHIIPNVDILSFTMNGATWINHEWLFQTIVYNIFNMFGPEGLLKMQIGVVVLTMLLLLFIGFSKEKQFVTNIMLCLVFLVYQQRFTLRPDLYSIMFFVIYIYILALHIDKKWTVFVLFIIQVLWTNIHGFFFFGPMFILIGLISEWLKRKVRLPFYWNESGRLEDDEYRRLKLIFVVVCLACLINPNGIKGALYPIGVFFSFSGADKIFFHHIQELQKPITWNNIFDSGHFLYYKIVIIISLISFLLNLRRIDISALFLWLVFLIFSLNAARNNAFFAIAAYLAFITNLLYISAENVIPIRFTDKKFAYITLIFANILFLMWIFDYGDALAHRGYYDFDKYKIKKETGGISLMMYPDKAVDFLIKNKIKGNFFNDFNSGAYLIGRIYPNIKVFIDGRTELYGGKFFNKYHDCLTDEKGKVFNEMDKKYHFTGAILSSATIPIPRKLLKYLYNSKDWVMVYFDYDAVIFLKNIDINKKLIDQFKIDLTKWKTKKANLTKLSDSRVRPYRYYNRAYALEAAGLDDAAITEAEEALKIAPGYFKPYMLLGDIYKKRKEYKKAFENFRYASIISQYKDKVKLKLALSMYDMGEYDAAIKEYKELFKIWPSDQNILYSLSKVYAKNKQYNMVMAPIEDAAKLNPKKINDNFKVADILIEQGEYALAYKIYNIDLSYKPESPSIYKRISMLFKKKGDANKAKKYFQKAISLDKNNAELKKEFNMMFNIEKK